MKKIRTLLVDDEISALRTLSGMLRNYCPQIEIVATASSVKEAMEKVKLYPPQLVFLDVEMPPFGSGFDFLKQCEDEKFGVVFTTAYPKYAIKAINSIQPWAYLVKPFSVDQLRAAVKVAEEKTRASEKINGSIVVADQRKGNVVVQIADIQYCKADSGITEIHYSNQNGLARIIVSRSLKDMMTELPSEFFCRCHHGYLVNMLAIERYEHTGRNGIIYLKKGGEIPISIGKKEEFKTDFEAYLAR